MEVLYQAEIWIGDWPDMVFGYTVAIIKKGDEFYYAKYNIHQKNDVDPTELECIRIPDEHIYTEAPRDFLRAPDPLPSNTYLKIPNLLDFGEEDHDIQYGHSLTLSEIRVCEILRHHPHRNVAPYLGCIEVDNRIRAICFPKYKITLSDYLRDGNEIDAEHCIAGIEKAVAHLHSLKLVHGDLTPSNIMLDEENEPILIDFDSCLQEGEEMLKGGTPEWSHCGAKIASYANDEYAMKRIREHLMNYVPGAAGYY